MTATPPPEPPFDSDLPRPWLAALRRYLARARKIASDPDRKPSAISDLGTTVSKAARKAWDKHSPVATTREQCDAQQALLIRMEDCEILVRRYAIAFEEYARQLRHTARELEIARLERERRARLRDQWWLTPGIVR